MIVTIIVTLGMATVVMGVRNDAVVVVIQMVITMMAGDH